MAPVGAERLTMLSRKKIARRTARLVRDAECSHRVRTEDIFLRDVPSVYAQHEMSFSEHPRINKAALARIQSFANGERPRFLILRGTKGLGKTCLAVSLARWFIRQRGFTAKYYTTTNLMYDISFNHESNPIWQATQCDVLILDDMGAATDGVTEHQKRGLWSIIEKRANSVGKVTIITTNMSIQSQKVSRSLSTVGLAEWLGESAWDRVSSSSLLISLSGDSMRQERA